MPPDPKAIPELTMGPCRDFGEPGLEEIARIPVPSVLPDHVKHVVGELRSAGLMPGAEALYIVELIDKMAVALGLVRYMDAGKKRDEALRLYDISARLSSIAHPARDDLLLAIGIVLFNLAPSEKLVGRLSAMKPLEGPLSYDFHSMMALNLLLMDRLDEARAHAGDAMGLAPDAKQRAYVEMLIGCIELRRGDPESAVRYFDDCAGNDRLRTLASFYAGIVRYEKDEFRDALRHFESARQGAHDHMDMLAVKCNIGACAVNIGDMGMGEDQFQAVNRSTWKQGGSREAYRRLLANSYLGIIARAKEDYPGSEAYYKEALKACIKIKNTVGIANQIGNMGLLNRYAGDHAAALRLLNACLVYSERMGYWNGIRFSFQNVYRTLMDIGHMPEARKLKDTYTSRYPGLE